MNRELLQAIRQKRIIEFDYHGHHRVVEPHVYGHYHGQEQLLGYQVGGTSSHGNIPEWRRFDVIEVHGLLVSSRTFPGRRQVPTGRHSEWDGPPYAIVE